MALHDLTLIEAVPDLTPTEAVLALTPLVPVIPVVVVAPVPKKAKKNQREPRGSDPAARNLDGSYRGLTDSEHERGNDRELDFEEY